MNTHTSNCMATLLTYSLFFVLCRFLSKSIFFIRWGLTMACGPRSSIQRANRTKCNGTLRVLPRLSFNGVRVFCLPQYSCFPPLPTQGKCCSRGDRPPARRPMTSRSLDPFIFPKQKWSTNAGPGKQFFGAFKFWFYILDHLSSPLFLHVVCFFA